MSVTLNQVRAHLMPEEPDYAKAAAELGPEALPVLRDLVAGGDTHLGSKAAYLASLLDAPGSADVLLVAAESPHPVVRVAAASGVRHLSAGREDVADDADDPLDEVLDRLLRDDDYGVRKVAVQSLNASRHPKARERLSRVASADPDEKMRGIASRLLEEPRPT
jgi:hypothetical protein